MAYRPVKMAGEKIIKITISREEYGIYVFRHSGDRENYDIFFLSVIKKLKSDLSKNKKNEFINNINNRKQSVVAKQISKRVKTEYCNMPVEHLPYIISALGIMNVKDYGFKKYPRYIFASEQTRVQILNMRESGLKPREIATITGTNKISIVNLLKEIRPSGSFFN